MGGGCWLALLRSFPKNRKARTGGTRTIHHGFPELQASLGKVTCSPHPDFVLLTVTRSSTLSPQILTVLFPAVRSRLLFSQCPVELSS